MLKGRRCNYGRKHGESCAAGGTVSHHYGVGKKEMKRDMGEHEVLV